jgi:hypothetical protein
MDHIAKAGARDRKKTKKNGVMNGASPKEHLKTNSAAAEQRLTHIHDRQRLVLWRRPLTTFYYFVLELGVLLRSYGAR